MANSYNSNPVVIDTTFTNGWKANQTLYSSSKTAIGPRPQKVLWTGRTASQTNTFLVSDPNDNTVLLQGSAVDGTTPADIEYDFESMGIGWRDFKVPTLGSGKLLVWYK